MRRPIQRFFLSRKTVLTLILLILGAVVIAYIVPQRHTEAWKAFLSDGADTFWAPWVSRLGLDRAYTSSWFAAVLFLFMISLILSTYDQIRLALKRTFGDGILQPNMPGRTFESRLPEEDMVAAVRNKGYIPISTKGREMRFVRHPWGYWGNVLFHSGMAVVIISSLLIVLTQKRGLLHLSEAEMHLPGAPWLAEERGILSAEFILPQAVRVESITPEFWETDDLKQLTTVLGFIDPKGNIHRETLAINRTLNYQGLKVYQSQRSGHLFFVELEDKEGKVRGVMLEMEHPSRRDRPSYGTFNVEGVPYTLKAKYFADATQQSLDSADPLVVIRLADREGVAGEVSLRKGGEGRIGPYRTRLVGVSKWAGVIFTDTTGMPGIFLGFFIIIIGGGITYFTPPRELLVIRKDGGISCTWRAARFERLYEDEFLRLSRDMGKRPS